MDETEDTASAGQDPEERIDGSEGEEGSDGMSAEMPDDGEQPNGGAPEFDEPHGDDGNAVGAAESVEEPPAKETPRQRRARVLAGVPAPAKAKRERKAKAAKAPKPEKAKREAKPKREPKPKGEKVAKAPKRGPSLAAAVTAYLVGFPDPVGIADMERALFASIPKAIALNGYRTDTLAKTNYANRLAGRKEITEIPESNETPESKRVEFGRRGILNRTLTAMRNNGVLIRVKGVGKNSVWKLSASARKVAEVKGE